MNSGKRLARDGYDTFVEPYQSIAKKGWLVTYMILLSYMSVFFMTSLIQTAAQEWQHSWVFVVVAVAAVVINFKH